MHRNGGMTNEADLAETTRIANLPMRDLVYGPAPRRVRLPLRLIFVAALLGMSMGCASQVKPVTAEVESVGQLSASYASIATAPVHHDAPPEFAGVVGSDDDAPVTVGNGQAIFDGSSEAPEVVSKRGLVVGEAR